MKSLVVGHGSLCADLVVVGEAPGAQENLEGSPFVGKSGKFLKNLLQISGINTERDVYFCNVIKCQPPKNRKPTKKEVLIHKPWLVQQINLINPKVTILAGTTAMRTILNNDEPISKVRGHWIVKEKKKFITIFHPSYLMRFSTRDFQSPYGLTLKDLWNVKEKLYNLQLCWI